MRALGNHLNPDDLTVPSGAEKLRHTGISLRGTHF